MANADAGGYVAVLVIDVHFPDAGSLKGKRKELSSLKAQLQTRLGVAVAETGHQDLWQRSTLTAALVSGDIATLTGAVERGRALAGGAAAAGRERRAAARLGGGPARMSPSPVRRIGLE
jgi:uncharacterized protein